MTTESLKAALEERGWTTYRAGGMTVLSKGSHRITIKPSQDVPGKILVIKGLVGEGDRTYNFHNTMIEAAREIEAFVRQESRPVQKETGGFNAFPHTLTDSEKAGIKNWEAASTWWNNIHTLRNYYLSPEEIAAWPTMSIPRRAKIIADKYRIYSR